MLESVGVAPGKGGLESGILHSSHEQSGPYSSAPSSSKPPPLSPTEKQLCSLSS